MQPPLTGESSDSLPRTGAVEAYDAPTGYYPGRMLNEGDDLSWEAIRLYTERLILRPFATRDDADALIDMFSDPEVMRWIDSSSRAPEPARARAERALMSWETDALGPFTIQTRSGGDVVGQAGLMVFDTRTWIPATLREASTSAQPELGWALIRRYWGNGYATEAAAAIRDWARQARAIDSLVSLIAPDNFASQRVARRLGAVPGEVITTTEQHGTSVVWEYPRAKT